MEAGSDGMSLYDDMVCSLWKQTVCDGTLFASRSLEPVYMYTRVENKQAVKFFCSGGSAGTGRRPANSGHASSISIETVFVSLSGRREATVWGEKGDSIFSTAEKRRGRPHCLSWGTLSLSLTSLSSPRRAWQKHGHLCMGFPSTPLLSREITW